MPLYAQIDLIVPKAYTAAPQNSGRYLEDGERGRVSLLDYRLRVQRLQG